MSETTKTIIGILIGNGIILVIIGLIFRFGGFHADIKRAFCDIKTLKNNVKAIANSLAKSPDIAFDHSLLKDYSPLQLTKQGKLFLEEKGFEKILTENEDVFFSFIEHDSPTSKYDVEISSYKAIFSLLQKEFFNPVKKYYYEHPQEDIQNFAKVASISLRDTYLAQHPDIKE